MSDDRPVVLEVADISKEYRLLHERSNARRLIPGKRGEVHTADSFLAVDGVSFSVRQGEVFGIIGHNGHGKSTILKMIAGIVEPTSGTIVIRGRLAALIELGLGFDPELSGSENVFFAGRLLGMSIDEIRAGFDEIVEFSGIGEFLDMPVKRYSTGMQARLGFAVATAGRPDVMLIDENLSVGDYAFQVRSLERIRTLSDEGMTLVVVSHSMWLLSQICDRMLLLDRGRPVLMGPPVDVIGTYVGASAFGADAPPTGLAAIDDRQAESGGSGIGDVATGPRLLPVTVDEVVVEPTEIEPGGPVTVRARITTLRPVDGDLAFSVFTSEEEIITERHLGPRDSLQSVGTFEVSIDVAAIPLGPGRYVLRVAVLRRGDDEPHQRFSNAITVAQATLRVVGPLSGRPGLVLNVEWDTTPS